MRPATPAGPTHRGQPAGAANRGRTARTASGRATSLLAATGGAAALRGAMGAALVLALLAAVAMAGCSGAGGPEGTLRAHVTGAPGATGEFRYVRAEVEAIELQKAGGGTLSLQPGNGTFDLVRLTDRRVATVLDAGVPPGAYLGLALRVPSARGSPLSGHGTEVAVAVPGGRIAVAAPFNVTADGAVDVLFGIRVVASADGVYQLQADATASGVLEGTVVAGRYEPAVPANDAAAEPQPSHPDHR